LDSAFNKKDRLYTKRAAPRHLPRLISLLLILTLCLPCAAQQCAVVKSGEPNNDSFLAAGDADDIIGRYRQGKAADQVAVWSRWSHSSSRAASPQYRQAVIRNFPAAWLSRRKVDPELEGDLKTLFRPLFSLYGRDYEIFLLDTRAPAILIDSGAVLVVSTGLLGRARSDDELFGFVAHEIAHAQFAERSVAAKELYAKLSARQEADSAGAREALRELARIELECDAVAARTLSVMGMDPMQFVRSVERINREFPAETGRGAEMGVNWHPPISTRLLVVESLAAGEGSKREPKASQLLRRIQGAGRSR
jgi:predicted Zn-dependent protease